LHVVAERGMMGGYVASEVTGGSKESLRMNRTGVAARGLIAVACVAVVLEVAFFLFVGPRAGWSEPLPSMDRDGKPVGGRGGRDPRLNDSAPGALRVAVGVGLLAIPVGFTLGLLLVKREGIGRIGSKPEGIEQEHDDHEMDVGV
jgi:hypothetical protein